MEETEDEGQILAGGLRREEKFKEGREWVYVFSPQLQLTRVAQETLL